MIKDLDWLVYVGTAGEQRLIVREIARENNYPIYKYNEKYYRTKDMRKIDGGYLMHKKRDKNKACKPFISPINYNIIRFRKGMKSLFEVLIPILIIISIYVFGFLKAVMVRV